MNAGYDIASGKDTFVDAVGGARIPAKEITLRGLYLENEDGSRILLGQVLVYAIDMSDTITAGVLGLNVIRHFVSKITFGVPTIIEMMPTYKIKTPCNNLLFGLWSKSDM